MVRVICASRRRDLAVCYGRIDHRWRVCRWRLGRGGKLLRYRGRRRLEFSRELRMDIEGCSFGGRSVGGRVRGSRGSKSRLRRHWVELVDCGELCIQNDPEGIGSIHENHIVEDVSSKNENWRLVNWWYSKGEQFPKKKRKSKRREEKNERNDYARSQPTFGEGQFGRQLHFDCSLSTFTVKSEV